MSFDRIVVSTNEDKKFICFLPIVAKAWKKFFPQVDIAVAFVTNRAFNDPLVEEMKRHAEVVLFSDIDGIPSANLAKVSRFILASRLSGISMIEDIDTIPLQKKFFKTITAKKKKEYTFGRWGRSLGGNPPRRKISNKYNVGRRARISIYDKSKKSILL